MELLAMQGQALNPLSIGFMLEGLYGNGLNLYQFVGSNAINNRDPLGLQYYPPEPASFSYEVAVDDITAELIGYTLAFAEGVVNRVTSGLVKTGELAIQLAWSLLPGSDAVQLAGALAEGRKAGTLDYAIAAAGLIPGGGKGGSILGKVYRGFRTGAAAYDAAITGGKVAKQTFKSFDELKRFLGPAAPGHAWHHIVEQSKMGEFAVDAIQSADNVIELPTHIHIRVSAYYSSIRAISAPKTVREWLRGKSWEEQYQFGLKVIADQGG